MKIIYKYELKEIDVNKLSMPEDAQILCVQTQKGIPYIWALVDDKKEVKSKFIMTIGTGHPMPDNPKKYIGTYQLFEGDLVYHVFELIN